MIAKTTPQLQLLGFLVLYVAVVVDNGLVQFDAGIDAVSVSDGQREPHCVVHSHREFHGFECPHVYADPFDTCRANTTIPLSVRPRHCCRDWGVCGGLIASAAVIMMGT